MSAAASTHRGLLVDDRPENLMFVRDYLVSIGYDVATALSGEAALKEVAEQSPDLVLLDLEMPQMSGLEVLGHLRAMEECVDLPVVVLSAHPRDEILGDCTRAGATDVVSKPIRLRVLRELLASLGL